MNTTTKIQNEQGINVGSFKEKCEVGVYSFKTLFSETKGCSMQEILQVLRIFPISITNEINDSLNKEVLKGELCSIVHSFKKGKIPGLKVF